MICLPVIQQLQTNAKVIAYLSHFQKYFEGESFR